MKKSKNYEYIDKIISSFSDLTDGINFSPFFDIIFKTSVNPIDLGVLGKDIYLIDIDVPENKEKYPLKYGNLYRKVDSGEVHIINDVEVKLEKINDNIFRVGGMCSGFKNNDYCELIRYEYVSNKEHCCLGNHCIIDTKGQIVFEADSAIKYPYYKKGYTVIECPNEN